MKIKRLSITQWLVIILVLVPVAISLFIKELILDRLFRCILTVEDERLEGEDK